MPSGSPTTRSLALLRKNGYTAQVVERWNPYAKVRVDLFKFIDIVAIKANKIVGVQTTSASGMSARYNKILELPEAKLWLEAGGLILLHGWGKKGKAGKRKLWKTEERWITLDAF